MKAKWFVILVLGVILLAFGCTKQPASKPTPTPMKESIEAAPPAPVTPETEPSFGFELPAPLPEKEPQEVEGFEGEEPLMGDEPVGNETEEGEPSDEDPF